MKQQFNTALLALTLMGSLMLGCKKEATIPTVTTTAVTAVTQNTAKSGGVIVNDGGGTPSSMGVCWSTSPEPTVADGHTSGNSSIGSFLSTLTGLTANTTYYARAFVTNSAGTGYGSTVTFTTLPANLPGVKTVFPTSITQTTAVSGGEVTSEGGAPTTRGVCWSTSETPTIADSKTTDGAGMGAFTSAIAGLTKSTTYYARAYATNVAGTGYGSTVVVRTMEGTVTDIDGNVYWTVLIGTQEWMAENLKVTRYRNGDPIANITDGTQWYYTSLSGAWCSYNNDSANVSKYGLIYNYPPTVDSRGVSPAGWHVPSDAEWTTLTDYLGGEAVAGYKMMPIHIDYTGAINGDNSSGFTALMGGYRYYADGRFMMLGRNGLWWSTTFSGPSYNVYYVRYLDYNRKDILRERGLLNTGASIRCLKDN